MKSILITGSDGFIGQGLVQKLQGKDYNLTLGQRKNQPISEFSGKHIFRQFDLTDTESILALFEDKPDVVVHLAGQAHNNSANNNNIFHVNCHGTERIARIANESGVKLFIFMSTVKVHGKHSGGGCLSEKSPEAAEDPYALSKLYGEQSLITVCNEGDMKFVILRPPLVYGPGVKANFLKFMSIIDSNVPLPLAGFNNCRSYIYVENLCHIIEGLFCRKNCWNQVYLVKDVDISTKDLAVKLSLALGRKPRIFMAPTNVIKIIARVLKKNSQFNSLYNSLLIDNSKLQNDLGWTTSMDLDTALENTIDWYMRTNKGLS